MSTTDNQEAPMKIVHSKRRGHPDTTYAQAITKLNILLEQAHKHAKKHRIQTFIAAPAGVDQITYYPFCGQDMIRSIIANMLLTYPMDAMHVINQLNQSANIIDSVDGVETPADVVDPALQVLAEGNVVVDASIEQESEATVSGLHETGDGLVDVKE